MYVTNITDNCILGLDYLKARKAVIDLSQEVLGVNDTIVKGKYKYAEGTPVSTHKDRLVNDCHLFPNLVMVEKGEDIQELKLKSGQLDSNKFRDISIVRLPDHMKDVFQRIGEELSNELWCIVIRCNTNTRIIRI